MATTLIEAYRNDYGYDIEFTITDSDGEPVDLTGNSGVLLKARLYLEPDTQPLSVNAAMIVTSAQDGEVKYTVEEGDFDTEGIYKAEVEVTYVDGKVITYGDIVISIKKDLAYVS